MVLNKGQQELAPHGGTAVRHRAKEGKRVKGQRRRFRLDIQKKG